MSNQAVESRELQKLGGVCRATLHWYADCAVLAGSCAAAGGRKQPGRRPGAARARRPVTVRIRRRLGSWADAPHLLPVGGAGLQAAAGIQHDARAAEAVHLRNRNTQQALEPVCCCFLLPASTRPRARQRRGRLSGSQPQGPAGRGRRQHDLLQEPQAVDGSAQRWDARADVYGTALTVSAQCHSRRVAQAAETIDQLIWLGGVDSLPLHSVVSRLRLGCCCASMPYSSPVPVLCADQCSIHSAAEATAQHDCSFWCHACA